MSREIKFRAWVQSRRFMGSSFVLHRELTVIPPDENLYDKFPHEAIFLQFTGLKDKNGKEIYEGDIVRFKTYGDEKRFGEIALEVKISTNYGARPYMPGWGYFNWVSRESEIIGNIFENPELLKS